MIRLDAPVPADAAALDAMARQSWEDTFAHFYRPDDLAAFVNTAFGPDGALIRDLFAPDIIWQVARAGSNIVGYAKMTPPWLDQAGPNDAQLSQLYVASDWHGKGVAQALMDWAIGGARSAGSPAMLLTVFEKNHRAITFYQRQGFVHVGDYAFPVGRQIDRDLVMRRVL